MDIKNIAAVIGFVALAEGLFVYAFKKRQHILICKSTSDFLWMLNYILLGSYSAAMVSLICTCRGLVFYNNDRYKPIVKKVLLFIFLCLTVIPPLIPIICGKENSIALLPIIGSVIAVIGFYQRDAKRVRLLGIIGTAPWLIYTLLVANYFSALNSAVQMTIGITRIIYDKKAP